MAWKHLYHGTIVHVHNCSTVFIFKHDDVMIIGNSFTLEIVQGFKNIQELLVYQTLYASVAFLSCNTEFGHVVCLWLGLNCDFLESTIFPLWVDSWFGHRAHISHIIHFHLRHIIVFVTCFFSSFIPQSLFHSAPTSCFSHTLKKLLLCLSTSTIACFRPEGRIEHSLLCNDLNTAIRWQSPNC